MIAEMIEQECYAIDRGDGNIAWEPLTDGSERPMMFGRRREAKAEADRHNRVWPGSAWKPLKVTIVWYRDDGK